MKDMVMQLVKNSTLNFTFLFIGTVAGILTIVFSQLPLEWALYCYTALIFGAFSLILEDKKRYFQFLLILTISVGRPFFVKHPFDIHFGGAQNVPEFFMSDIWLFMLLFIWMSTIIKTKRTAKLSIHHIDIAIFMLFSWSFFSVLHAQNYEHGFYELIRVIKQFLLFFYISRNIKTKDDVNFVMFCLLAVLFIQSIIAIFQFVGGVMPFGLFQDIHTESTTGANRVGGTLYGVSNLSQFLELLIPLPLALSFFQKTKRWQFLCLILFSLGTLALIFTFSRGAILSLIFAVLLIMMIQSIFVLINQQNRLSIFFKSLVVLLIMVIVFLSLKNEILLRFTSYDAGSAQSRIPMMTVALSIITENPLFGIGLNNYNDVMGYYGMYVLLPAAVYAVHNTYLFYASEIGLPGLLILVSIIIMVYKKAYAILKHQNDQLKYITVGIMAGVTSYLIIHCNVTMGFKYVVPVGNLIWLQFGLIVAIEKIVRKERNTSVKLISST